MHLKHKWTCNYLLPGPEVKFRVQERVVEVDGVELPPAADVGERGRGGEEHVGSETEVAGNENVAQTALTENKDWNAVPNPLTFSKTVLVLVIPNQQ